MSDVVNRRKQITKDGRGATIHDWLEEKEDEIDLEPFEWLNFLKILSQLNSEIGHFDTAGVCVFRWNMSEHKSGFISRVFHLFFKSDLRTFICQHGPRFSAAKTKTFWEMWLWWKYQHKFPLAWYQIRRPAAGETGLYPILGGFT